MPSPPFPRSWKRRRDADTVVLYVDGITATRPTTSPNFTPTDLNTMIEQATTHAVTAYHAAANLGNQIEAILRFARRDDDISLLILKATDWGTTVLNRGGIRDSLIVRNSSLR